MSRYDENTQLLKLNAVIPKIGRMQLANPPKEIRDLLKQIEFAVRERINTVLASQVVLEVSPLSVLEQEMFDEMNNYRARRGLSPLVVNQKLNQAAQILADDMAKQ